MNTADTGANFRNSQLGKNDVYCFVTWLQQRQEFTQAEKEKLALLAAEYQRSHVRVGWASRFTSDPLGNSSAGSA